MESVLLDNVYHTTTYIKLILNIKPSHKIYSEKQENNIKIMETFIIFDKVIGNLAVTLLFILKYKISTFSKFYYREKFCFFFNSNIKINK